MKEQPKHNKKIRKRPLPITLSSKEFEQVRKVRVERKSSLLCEIAQNIYPEEVIL